MELMQVQPTGKTPISQSTPVYVITKEGKPYNSEGIAYIKEHLKHDFNINTDLAIYSGVALNKGSVLTKLLKKKANTYLVLSTKETIGFLPPEAINDICLNLSEHANESSWEVLMKSCGLEPY